MFGIRNRVPISRLCTQAELQSEEFQKWARILREPHMYLHRKLWEWCFITDVLHRANMLSEGRTGLGFAVGREPLVSYFASRGVSILASDLDVERASTAGWVGSNEHAASLEILNERNICPPDLFADKVRFQEVDMNNFRSENLGQFDFVWSSCAFEHLGSLEHGLKYVENAMACVKPGGLAVHTTEFNVGSNDETHAEGGTVIYRRRDIDELVTRLRNAGHKVNVKYTFGDQPADYNVDVPPYTHDVHLKLHLMGHTTTSIGLVISKK
jgi:2-polyprenyl-3-methyl-5-hydroxy-6-metoxy-1,4-benzoquinol methylase